MNSTYLILIGYGVFIALACFLLLSKPVKVYSEDFWWDGHGGLRFSRSTLYKHKYLPIYFIEHRCRPNHPKSHPNYSAFNEMVRLRKRGWLVFSVQSFKN